MLYVLHHLKVRFRHRLTRSAKLSDAKSHRFDPGKAGDSLLKVTPESDRVKQCVLGQVLATQAVGMFYGVAVIIGNTIFKGNSLNA